MTTYTLFTDPHLGTKRAAHTTRESAQRLQDALYSKAIASALPGSNPICLGDLFDRSQNPEATLVQGYNVASRCIATLAGNHDCSNREGTVTSLDALAEMGCPIVRSPNLSTPFFDVLNGIYFVPHHASQALFEKAMFDAAAHAAHHREGLASVLMLHCNYDCAFEIEDDTLNLPAEVAEQLLNAFDYIFLGHEHKPSTHFDGRVVILGNTHPTSFADISDKFIYELAMTDDSLDLKPIEVWSKAKCYRELKFGELPDLTGVQFVDVVGLHEEGDGVAINQFLQEVWAAGPDLLAVRNNVKIGDHMASVENAEPVSVADLGARIAQDLEGSDMKPLYIELMNEVTA